MFLGMFSVRFVYKKVVTKCKIAMAVYLKKKSLQKRFVYLFIVTESIKLIWLPKALHGSV